MEFDRAFGWLQATPVAKAISENEILFPWIESVHVLAIVLVVGTISIVDLRLLGVASLDRSARRLMQDVLPFTWGAFVVAAITGSLMFVSDAVNYAHNFFSGESSSCFCWQASTWRSFISSALVISRIGMSPSRRRGQPRSPPRYRCLCG